ncbi:MAG: 3-hydroxyacyl-CoA dehydrogenase [Rhodospirillaceae bacterium]|nr:3-hydroxyacyl-CoA dehydrogenase [Magnetovibrio sp.]MAY66450.1 3-hydroxyacyl-CoA dehydrogenase [Rhodospirillaceae bacterium]
MPASDPATPVILDIKERIAVVTIDSPPVNALGHAVRSGVMAALDKAEADDAVDAVVIRGAGRCFSGGADIREFGTPPAEPTLRQVCARVEDFPKIVVAALHSTAFGGGLELPLSCHYRVADASAQIALPEVKLGIVPGSGGTQRLPRIVGAKRALKVILSGDPFAAREAHDLGVLDAILDGDLTAAAVAYAAKLVADGAPLRKVRDLAVADADAEVFAEARKTWEKRSRGLLAPLACIDCVEIAATKSFDEGMQREREIFVACRDSEQSKAQRHLFFAEREAAKVKDVPRDTVKRPINTAAVVGCGTMGGGIAMCLVNVGIPVTVLETSEDALKAGLAKIEKNYAATVSKGRLTQAEMDKRMGLINGTTNYADLGPADIVIEAVFEEMDLKRTIFGELDKVMKPGAVLATNTSTLDIDEIAAATKRPADVIGTHFFSPANVMKLMENVRGKETAKDVIATVMALGKTIQKIPVLVGNCDGFVGNRMYHRYTRQAYFLLEEGALPQQVDKVFLDFGFAMGPLAVGDLAGLDVSYLVRKRQVQFIKPGERWPVAADRVVEAGRKGQKTNAGWYRYEEGSRKPLPDPEVQKIIEATSAELGIERREITDQEIHERCFYALINEGAKILDEGMAQRASDIDIIWTNGYGFPIAKGGPMFHADQVGAKHVYERLAHWAKVASPALEPAPLLEKLARTGGTFADL